MPSTYTLISSNVLSSSAASVTFSAIPSTYTDLVLRISGRYSAAVVAAIIQLQPNGNTTSTNYSQTSVRGTGATASSTNDSTSGGRAYLPMGYIAGDSATANTFGSVEYYIPNYATTAAKPMSGNSAAESNTSTISFVNYATAGLFHNTTPLTSLVILPNSDNFMAGSSFYLYGIKNS